MSALERQEKVSGYECLAAVLADAYDQAAIGKGAQRHADGTAFDEQPMQQLIDLYGPGFALGQAAKKAQESQRMKPDAARRELLGAIVYLAGAIVSLDKKHGQLELSPELIEACNDNDLPKREPRPTSELVGTANYEYAPVRHCMTCAHSRGSMCVNPKGSCSHLFGTFDLREPRAHG